MKLHEGKNGVIETMGKKKSELIFATFKERIFFPFKYCHILQPSNTSSPVFLQHVLNKSNEIEVKPQKQRRKTQIQIAFTIHY